MDRQIKRRLFIAIGVAFVLWGIMFFPAVAQFVPFWPAMSASAILLLALSFGFRKDWGESLQFTPFTFLSGAGLATFLWGVFWLGDKVSARLFAFAPGQIDHVYALKEGTLPFFIGFLLLVLIGPAEEIFWRGYVQRTLSDLYGKNTAAFLAISAYTLVHLFSFNFMLLVAAAVLGVVWSAIYRFYPRRLPTLIVSHALWDAAVFVFFPFR